jgi:hypothetical protein
MEHADGEVERHDDAEMDEVDVVGLADRHDRLTEEVAAGDIGEVDRDGNEMAAPTITRTPAIRISSTRERAEMASGVLGKDTALKKPLPESRSPARRGFEIRALTPNYGAPAERPQ